MRRLGIFGTSGFAREVGDIAFDLGYEPVYIARDAAERDGWIGEGAVVLESDLRDLAGESFAVGIGDNAVRERVARRYPDLDFPPLIHPSATFGRGQRAVIEARRGVIVTAGVRFTNHIAVGDFCIFNLNATVGHDVVVDDFVNIAPGATISGNVHLCSRTWVGTGAAVNQGTGTTKLVVGADCVVGSGAVVVKDCDAGGVYVGVPARRMR